MEVHPSGFSRFQARLFHSRSPVAAALRSPQTSGPAGEVKAAVKTRFSGSGSRSLKTPRVIERSCTLTAP
ncbi:MAG: hypothetical protein LBU25_04445 [Treponema sp.]|nr:hypothetical protein [Treponema sp.]